MNTAIAQHLSVSAAAITRIEEWANVIFCVVKGLGARFVSKKVVKLDKQMWEKSNSKGVLTLVDQGFGAVELRLNGKFRGQYGCKAEVFGDAKGTKYFIGTRFGLTADEYESAKSFVQKVRNGYAVEDKQYTINPEWVAFNNLNNEGGEGYNPHTKYILK